MKIWRFAGSTVLAALVCFAAIPAARAQTPGASASAPLAGYVPSGALVYFGWAGQPSDWPGYSGSRFQTFLTNSHLGALVQPIFNGFVQAQAQNNPLMGLILAQAVNDVNTILSHPFALYVMQVGPASAGGKPIPRIGLIIDAGADTSGILQMINMGKTGPDHMIGSAGNIVYDLINPTADMESLASGKFDHLVAPLSGDERFDSALADGPSQPAYALYVNLAELRTQAAAMTASPDVPLGIQSFYKTVDPFAPLAAYTTLGFSGGLVNGNSVTAEFLGGSYAGGNGTTDIEHLLHIVPVDSPDLATFTLDPGAMYDWVEFMANQVGGNEADMINSSIEQANSMTGLDLKNDLLACLGPHWLFYHSNTMQEEGWRGDVLVNHLNDAETLEQNLEIVGPMVVLGLNAYLHQSGYQGPPGKLHQINMGGVIINSVQTPDLSPSWMIYGGDFYFALFPIPLEQVVRVHHGGESILDAPGFKNMLAQIGAPADYAGVSYTDAPDLVSQGYLFLQSLIQTAQAAGGPATALVVIPSLTSIFPGLDELKAMLIPSGSVSWNDAKGLHTRSISAFPGSFLLTPQSFSVELNLFSPANAAIINALSRVYLLVAPRTVTTTAPAAQASTSQP